LKGTITEPLLQSVYVHSPKTNALAVASRKMPALRPDESMLPRRRIEKERDIYRRVREQCFAVVNCE
jgi:hypothetical protein